MFDVFNEFLDNSTFVNLTWTSAKKSCHFDYFNFCSFCCFWRCSYACRRQDYGLECSGDRVLVALFLPALWGPSATATLAATPAVRPILARYCWRQASTLRVADATVQPNAYLLLQPKTVLPQNANFLVKAFQKNTIYSLRPPQNRVFIVFEKAQENIFVNKKNRYFQKKFWKHCPPLSKKTRNFFN